MNPLVQPDIQQQESNQTVDEENQDEKEDYKKPKRPLHTRLFSYLRETWTGVKFSLDTELEELETPPRSRPESLESLCKATKFSQTEIKRIYRGFKAECPSGVVKEDTFKLIYSQFFPQSANAGQYAHYVFNTLDQEKTGLVNFEDFVQNLSILSRGSLEEKLRWIFALYDINGDGCVTREEMNDIVSAIYDLMGQRDPSTEDQIVQDKVDNIFQKMDLNGDGIISLEEFITCCSKDQEIINSMSALSSL